MNDASVAQALEAPTDLPKKVMAWSPDIARLHATYRLTLDPELLDQLAKIHMPLAEYVARRYARRNVELEDLTSSAYLGLTKALVRFDPTRGLAFTTYAYRLIDGEVRAYLRDKSRIIRLPRPIDDLLPKIYRAREELTQRLGDTPSQADIAAELKVSLDEVQEADAASRTCVMIEAISETEGPRSGDQQMKLIEDADVLRRLFARLSEDSDYERLIRVFTLRYNHAMTQSQIAAAMGVSQMQISRLLKKLLGLLASYLSDEKTE